MSSRRCSCGRSCSSSAGSRSSSARPWTRSTGATRGCRASGRRFERYLTLGRVEEGSGLTAVAGDFAQHGQRIAAAAVVVAVLASLMVSYTRARAEALGVECKVGIATRPVRVVILSIGLVFARGASLGNFELLQPAVYVLAVLGLVTVGQRIWHVRRELIDAG